MKMPPDNPVGGDEDWTDAKNNCRCDLIDRKYAGGLTKDELLELTQLKEQMERYRQQVAPFPVEYAKQLHQELLAKAGLTPLDPGPSDTIEDA